MCYMNLVLASFELFQSKGVLAAMNIMSTFNNFNRLPPVQSLPMIIGSSQDGYDTKVSQLSPLNSKAKSGWYMYLGLTARYIRVTTDMGLLCMIKMSNTVAQEGELGYPNTFDLSKDFGIIHQSDHQTLLLRHSPAVFIGYTFLRRLLSRRSKREFSGYPHERPGSI